MARLSWLALIIMLAGCAVTDPPPLANGPWKPVPYLGFVESIDALAGPQAVDCGFLDLLVPRHEDPRRRRAAHDCVQVSMQKGIGFKFGTVRVPIDSFATQVLVRTADGDLWMITYDVMIDGSVPQQWNQVCKSVTLDRKTLMLDGTDCEMRSTGILEKT